MNYLKKELYALVQKDEQIFDFIQESALDGMWYWDLENSENEWMNPKFWITLGYDPSQMPHKASAWQDIIHPDDLKLATENFQRHCADPEHPYDQVVRYRHKDGSTVWIRCRGIAVRDDNGTPIRMLGAHADITHEKEVEEELRIQNERYSNVLLGTDLGTWEWNVQTGETFFNERWANIIGYELEELQPVDINTRERFSYPEDLKRSNELLEAHFKGKTNFYEVEVRMKHKDGHWVWVLDRGKVIRWDAHGKPLWMTGSHQDITERKKIDEELRHYKDLLERTNNVARIGTWEVDLINNIPVWSQVTREIHEVPEDYKVDLQHALDFFKEGDKHEITSAFQSAVNEGKGYDLELQIITFKGNEKWVRAIGIPEMREGRCEGIYGIFQDITPLKSIQLELGTALGQVQGILNASSQVAIIGTDVTGQITTFNVGAENLLGYKASEMVGKQTPAIVHKREEVEQRGNELSELFHKEIRGFDVFVEYAKNGQFESREWTYVRKDGTEFPVQLVVTANRDRSGEIIGFLGVASDISRMKAAEKEIKTLLNVTSDQNKRLLNFAHIVSHNLRSHSGNLLMLLGLIGEEYDEVHEMQMFPMLQTAADNLRETVDHLNEVVAMNTGTSENLKAVNLHEAIEQARGSVQALLTSSGVGFTNKVDKRAQVDAVPAYLDSILLNFITNAIKYRSPDRVPALEIASKSVAGQQVVSITDNGMGIDLKRHRDKLFGMYKTFHRNKDARGIGLFITKNQIEAMGGKVEVESMVNEGTTFKIYLNEKN